MDKKILSGEENQVIKKRQAAKHNNLLLWGAGIGGGVLLIGTSFFIAFLLFSHGDREGDDTNPPGFNGDGPSQREGSAGGGPFTCSGQSQGTPPVAGNVTAVSDASITLKLDDGSSQTFSVQSGTRMILGPNSSDTTYKATSIHIGDSVGVVPSSSDQSVADMVLLDFQGVVHNK